MSYIVDKFMLLKHGGPSSLEMAEAMKVALKIDNEQDIDRILKAQKKAKVSHIESYESNVPEQFGRTAQEIVDLIDADNARKSNSGKVHKDAMDLAAKAFLDAEKQEKTAPEAVDMAEDAIGDQLAGTESENVNRNTISAWLRQIQKMGATSIPPAPKGRPGKK